jgi:hypothetical protein
MLLDSTLAARSIDTGSSDSAISLAPWPSPWTAPSAAYPPAARAICRPALRPSAPSVSFAPMPAPGPVKAPATAPTVDAIGWSSRALRIAATSPRENSASARTSLPPSVALESAEPTPAAAAPRVDVSRSGVVSNAWPCCAVAGLKPRAIAASASSSGMSTNVPSGVTRRTLTSWLRW